MISRFKFNTLVIEHNGLHSKEFLILVICARVCVFSHSFALGGISLINRIVGNVVNTLMPMTRHITCYRGSLIYWFCWHFTCTLFLRCTNANRLFEILCGNGRIEPLFFFHRFAYHWYITSILSFAHFTLLNARIYRDACAHQPAHTLGVIKTADCVPHITSHHIMAFINQTKTYTLCLYLSLILLCKKNRWTIFTCRMMSTFKCVFAFISFTH